ncbi:MAG TPA: DUF4350 domain-containing protein [Rhodanobacteraceae bacterium]
MANNPRLRGWLVVLALVIGAACAGYLSTRHVWTADWSATRSASLSSATRMVLGKLKGPVQITSYARPDGPLRGEIAGFVERYQRVKPDLTLSFVDPERDPNATRTAGITVNGELIVRYRGHTRYLKRLSESSLTNALESLARGGERIVAFVTGNGERSPVGAQPADMGAFVTQLSRRGVRVVPLNFTHVPAVPEGTNLVVLASPLAQLPGGAVKALTNYVADGGNLLWLAEPDTHDLGLAPLAAELGIQKLPGVLVDGQGNALGLHDPRLIAVGQYPPQAITRGFAQTTLFARVAGLARASLGAWQVTPFLRSSVQSWNQIAPIDEAHPSTIRFDAASGETRGPLDFGLALTRLSPSPSHQQQRVVVIGDGDFLSNAWSSMAGNQALGNRVFNWLLGDDALIGVPPRVVRIAPLALTQTGLNVFAGVFLILLPLLLVVIGLALAWRRRHR